MGAERVGFCEVETALARFVGDDSSGYFSIFFASFWHMRVPYLEYIVHGSALPLLRPDGSASREPNRDETHHAVLVTVGL